jgi:predicted CXXCH cytochrome family protein
MRTIQVLALVALALLMTGAERKSVRETSHNLSVSGPGAIRAVSETRVCIFCHSSHNATNEGPLWNHETSSPAAFRTYDRATMEGTAQQPNGATKLCLSCHDGTIAVGSVHSSGREIQMQNVGGSGQIPAGRSSHIGTDLSGTHPVSVKMDEQTSMARTSLRWPPFDPEAEVALDQFGFVQCTACHDPHGSRSETLPFWQKESYSEVCRVCHAY